jgi:aspartate racemase
MTKKIGIVGGLGWRATADYYGGLHELAERSGGAAPALEIGIESLDLSVARTLLADGETDGCWDGFDNYHHAALMRLERSEAEIALIACNTPHERLPEIVRGIRMCVIDIFEAVCAKAARRGARRLLILGTDVTMRSARFRRLLGARGIEAIAPQGSSAEDLQQLICRLEQGSTAGAWPKLLEIVHSSLGEPRADDFVGLHCTELPLALPQPIRSPTFVWGGVKFLNASMTHVDAALRAAGFALAPGSSMPSSAAVEANGPRSNDPPARPGLY